ncbi:MAG: hypothetical protein KDC67_08935 [Ignavibacteriae bacterium]|nr:hypothetical protein [Ignavibacteriota bacterium]
MYLAQTTNISPTQSSFYVSLLESIIDKTSSKNKKDIDFAINEAKEVATGRREIFNISNNHYFFITTLLLDYEEKLKSLKDNNYGTETYREILEILK